MFCNSTPEYFISLIVIRKVAASTILHAVVQPNHTPELFFIQYLAETRTAALFYLIHFSQPFKYINITQVEAVYTALAAEAVGGGIGMCSSSRYTGNASHARKRSRGLADAAGINDKPAGLLHATISRYFDEGPVEVATEAPPDKDGCDGDSTTTSNIDGRSSAVDVIDSNTITGNASDDKNGRGSNSEGRVNPYDSKKVENHVEPTTTTAATASPASEGTMTTTNRPTNSRDCPMPHQPLDKRAGEVLVRDASVLVTDPSFQGRLVQDPDDNWGGGGGGGGGLGFFDVATGGTAVAGVGGAGGLGKSGGGMAPHSWLLKVIYHRADMPLLSRIAIIACLWRVFHGGGEVAVNNNKCGMFRLQSTHTGLCPVLSSGI